MSLDPAPPSDRPVLATVLATLAERLSPAPSGKLFDVRRQTARELAHAVGDTDFLADIGMSEPPSRPLRRAAVLVPIILRDEATVLLTQRAAHLPKHPGQIAFPGGKIEPFDVDPIAAAVREAEEEVGLPPALVRPVGYLDGFWTFTGFHIDPVVALVEPGFSVRIDPNEVEAAFEVPLAFLLDAANHERHEGLRNGRHRYYYAMPYQDRYIWGVTAAILKNLHGRLGG